MNTLFGEHDGQGCDTAVEGRTVLEVAARRGVRKARAKEAAQAMPKADEVQGAEVRSPVRKGMDYGSSEIGRMEEWSGRTNCFRLIHPNGIICAISSSLAAEYHDTGDRVICFGTYQDAAAVAAGMEADHQTREQL